MEVITSAEADGADRDRLLSANAPEHTSSVSLKSVELSARLVKLAHQP
jgi:hypothetical protein